MYVLKLLIALRVASVASQDSSTIYLIRHGEKDSKGCESSTGLKRADNLYDVFKQKFSLPSYVFAYKYSGSECQRCQQTVKPIAKKLGVSVDFDHGSHDCKREWGSCKSFTDAIMKETSKGPVLVASEHGHIQYLANDLGVPQSDIPDWKGNDYDSVYVITVSGGKATLEHKYQTKEVVASEDSSTVYLIRHGEKDSKGCESSKGLKRADNLYDVFKQKFSLPSYVFAYKYSGSECQRCQQTVKPIAKKLDVSVDFDHGSHDCKREWGSCKKFTDAIKKETSKGPVLVASEHGHIQYLAHDLGVAKSDIPDWKGSDYDSVYVVTLSGGKATLEHKHQTKSGLDELVV